jgi:hypothetical protein
VLFLAVIEQLQKSTLWMQVGVKNLKLVGSQSWDLMREGEAEKQVLLLLLLFFSVSFSCFVMKFLTFWSTFVINMHEPLNFLVQIRP